MRTVVHLGERVTCLVDGELTGEAIERAHAHLASCPDCRYLVETERLIKAWLGEADPPDPSADLERRLLSLGGPAGPLPPRRAIVPGSPRPVLEHPFGVEPPRRRAGSRLGVPRRPRGHRSSPRPPGRRRSRPRVRFVVVAVGAAAVLGLSAGGYRVATSGTGVPTLPPTDSLVVEQGSLSGTVPSELFPTARQQPSLDGSMETKSREQETADSR